jgi:hypothetical protein
VISERGRERLEYPLVGLVLGFGAGLTLAAVMTIVRDRPILRRDIAENLGASIIAQVPASRWGPSRLWRRSRDTVERRRAATTLARLVRDAPGTVSLLELGAAKAAAEMVVGVVEKLADERTVLILDDPPNRYLRALAAKEGRGIPLIEGDDFPPVPAPTNERPWCRIGMGSVGPGAAWTDLRRLGTETLLVVRCGHATTSWLHTVARQLADLQILVLGVVLVHPDPRDRSDGTLWDGLHLALRGRARPAVVVAPSEVDANGQLGAAPVTAAAMNGHIEQPTSRP